jgi:hypothetical protein
MKFNAEYYISHIFDSLAEWRGSQVTGSDRILHVDAGNARPRTAEKASEFLAGNSIKRAPHPPYSPNLAPFNFYHFRYIKGRLSSASFEEPDQLLQAIDVIFQSIDKVVLECAFQE